MKPLVSIFISLVICMTTSLAITASENNSTPIADKQAVLKHQTPTSNRPMKPSSRSLVCIYTQGYLEIEMPINTEYLDVTISDDNIPVWSGTVTQDEPSADIPVLYGEHTITCITDGGHIFTGYLSF